MSLSKQMAVLSTALTFTTLGLCPAAIACEGTYEISSPAKGCARLDGQVITIAFDSSYPECRFSSAPKVTITNTSVTSSNDSIAAAVLSKTSKDFSVRVTTHGRHGNEVCAPSSFTWKASQ